MTFLMQLFAIHRVCRSHHTLDRSVISLAGKLNHHGQGCWWNKWKRRNCAVLALLFCHVILPRPCSKHGSKPDLARGSAGLWLRLGWRVCGKDRFTKNGLRGPRCCWKPWSVVSWFLFQLMMLTLECQTSLGVFENQVANLHHFLLATTCEMLSTGNCNERSISACNLSACFFSPIVFSWDENRLLALRCAACLC